MSFPGFPPGASSGGSGGGGLPQRPSTLSVGGVASNNVPPSAAGAFLPPLGQDFASPGGGLVSGGGVPPSMDAHARAEVRARLKFCARARRLRAARAPRRRCARRRASQGRASAPPGWYSALIPPDCLMARRTPTVGGEAHSLVCVLFVPFPAGRALARELRAVHPRPALTRACQADALGAEMYGAPLAEDTRPEYFAGMEGACCAARCCSRRVWPCVAALRGRRRGGGLCAWHDVCCCGAGGRSRRTEGACVARGRGSVRSAAAAVAGLC